MNTCLHGVQINKKNPSLAAYIIVKTRNFRPSVSRLTGPTREFTLTCPKEEKEATYPPEAIKNLMHN